MALPGTDSFFFLLIIVLFSFSSLLTFSSFSTFHQLKVGGRNALCRRHFVRSLIKAINTIYESAAGWFHTLVQISAAAHMQTEASLILF